MSYAKKMRQYFREYEAEGNPMPADLNDVYEWARRTGRWTPPVELARRAFVEDMSRALREDYFTDDNGLRVRAMHPAVVKRNGAQYHLWHDARKANHEHMAAAFTGRRNGVVGDLKQLKTDVDWYNRTFADRPNIQLVLNFEDDIAEIEAAEAKARRSTRRRADLSGNASGKAA
jgi:hypothetical protein